MTEKISNYAKERDEFTNVNSGSSITENKKNRQQSSKDPDFIYKNAFTMKKRRNSNRIKITDYGLRNLSMSDITIRDENLDLKQSINKYKVEISLLKTQLNKVESELNKEINSEDNPYDIIRLAKKLKSQKEANKSLKEENKKKDEKIEEIRKKTKFCQINELETEINLLTNENKNLLRIIQDFSLNKVQDFPILKDEDIQKSIMMEHLKKENKRLVESIEEKNEEIIK